MKRGEVMPDPPPKKQKVSPEDVQRNIDISRLMTWIDVSEKSERKKVREIIAAWYDECARCHDAHVSHKGSWIPNFGDIVSKDENKRTNATRSLFKPKLHPIVMCTLEGATVDEQKQKTFLNSAHRPPFFGIGQADRLNTYWLGLLETKIPPAVVLPKEILSENFVIPSEPPQPSGMCISNKPMDVKKEDLRTIVLSRELREPTLVGDYASYAKMLSGNERLPLIPKNYIEVGQKAGGLVIACDLQNPGWLWDDTKRKSLLSAHASRFLKEGAPLVILSVWRAPELKSYVAKRDCVKWGKDGVELRKALNAILEKKIAELGPRTKIPRGVRLVAKFFKRRQIKGIKKLL